MTTKAYGARAADKPLEPMDIQRRAPGARDVQIEIAWCGVCHSDLHTVRSEWGGTLYPVRTRPRDRRSRQRGRRRGGATRVGDIVGVGCLVGSCQRCDSCADGLEQYCENGFTGTYNGATPDAPGHTLGGYSQRIVVDEKFVLKIRHPKTSSPRSRRCCAPASPRIRRCATGTSARARRSASSASAASATWA